MTGARRLLERMLRSLRISSSSLYAATDFRFANRLTGALWLFQAAIVVILLPLSPPTDSSLGAWGWAITGALVVACVVFSIAIIRHPLVIGPTAMFAAAVVALAGLASVAALAGPDSPYPELYLVLALSVAALHPPRRVIAFMVLVAAALATPLLLDGWSSEQAAENLARLLLFSTAAGFANRYTVIGRAERRGLLRRERGAQQLARIDALTGLGNRRAFDEALTAAIARHRGSTRPLCLLIGDLDDFKAINDRHGHVAGDACLQQVAAVVQRTVRRPDACFRWGGDEFALIIDTDQAGGERLRDRICKAVARECSTPDGGGLHVAFGIAELGDEIDAAALVTAADLHLITAKATA